MDQINKRRDYNEETLSFSLSLYWWELDNFDETVIQRKVDDSIASLGGKNNAKDGWIALFQTKNGGTGYRAGEKIAIKANINGSAIMDDDTSGETAMSYTNPVQIDHVAADFPSARFIISHGGWPWVQEVLHVAFRRPNIYISPDMYLFNMPGWQDYVTACNFSEQPIPSCRSRVVWNIS